MVRMERSIALRITGTIRQTPVIDFFPLAGHERRFQPLSLGFDSREERSTSWHLYLTDPQILKAIDRSIRIINRTGTASGILRLPHRWKQAS
ncbi:hypothetical protein AVEN_14030-1 [Araneus ventricosus]|uniref:Uncharacterized protein n=1 Tax=Araneus ventricosus TaxID=182803 RepID=A0A4Y2PAV1_ARAVE|nr:hypothetical protein AVEN_14030-1 [Araneus ventricosus]